MLLDRGGRVRSACVQPTGMSASNPSPLAKALAKVCAGCPVCRHARRRQRGIVCWLVSRVGARLCPFCRAYERVHGRKADGSCPAPAGRPGAPPAE